MDQEKIRELTRTTFKYVIVGGVLFWITYYQPIVISREQTIRLLGLDTDLSTSILFTPSLCFLIFDYFSTLVERIFLGDIKTHLGKGLTNIGVAASAWLLIKNLSIPNVWSSLGFFLFILTGVLTISRIVKLVLS